MPSSACTSRKTFPRSHVILKLLQERDQVKIIQPAQRARLGIRELPAIPKLMASVLHLCANGLLAYTIESGEAHVTYGRRTARSRSKGGSPSENQATNAAQTTAT
jgi:hypothetical protein